MKEEKYTLTVDDFVVAVTKKRMKNMYLRVSREDGSIRVSAPHGVRDNEIVRFVRTRRNWIEKNRREYEKAAETRTERKEYTKQEEEYRKRVLRGRVLELFRKWQPVMKVRASGVTVRRMKTRWGSCNVRTRHININLALADKPPECLEYVVVHELTHLLEPSHNQIFWNYMTEFYPNWREVRSKLNYGEGNL